MSLSLPERTTEIEDPDRDEVEAAIRELRGNGEVWLGEPALIGLGVTGGPERYFVGFTNQVQQIQLQALAADPPAEDAIAIIGGQNSALPSANLVSVEEALSAAMYFLTNQAPSPDLEWQRL